MQREFKNFTGKERSPVVTNMEMHVRPQMRRMNQEQDHRKRIDMQRKLNLIKLREDIEAKNSDSIESQLVN